MTIPRSTLIPKTVLHNASCLQRQVRIEKHTDPCECIGGGKRETAAVEYVLSRRHDLVPARIALAVLNNRELHGNFLLHGLPICNVEASTQLSASRRCDGTALHISLVPEPVGELL